jgi:DnaJ-like protein
MTEQKPPGMSWESWIEQQIREAREAGLFDNLPGAGKPLPNITDDYDPLWWVKQLAQREQISVLPPSLEVLRKVESEMAVLWKLGDEATVRSRILALNREIAKVNSRASEGPPTRLGPLDVEAIVAEWHARRASS